MKKYCFLIFITLFISNGISSQINKEILNSYNIKWNTQSKNSSESMPVGGGDVGLNVWVENDELLFYIAKSGTFDENNMMPKLGRVRVKLSPNPFTNGDFSQELNLIDGNIIINGQNAQNSANITIWTEIKNPIIHLEIDTKKKTDVFINYENWRFEDRLLEKFEGFGTSYKWVLPENLTVKKDEIQFYDNQILFYHQNKGETVFDVTVKQQKLESHIDSLTNPLKNLIFGGKIKGKNFISNGVSNGEYNSIKHKSWELKTIVPTQKSHIEIALNSGYYNNIENWTNDLNKNKSHNSIKKAKAETKKWWNNFWDRSHIFINHQTADISDSIWQTGRNYNLFRYMLACNAYGSYPTKFNGGLFTFDPIFVNKQRPYNADFRNWGGGTFTAQNQRLVYYPMFKSGDLDMIYPQLDFYLNLLKNAEIRTKEYWGHNGACFTEQIENFGLPNPTEYGWKRPDYFDDGIEYNAWLEYQWDTVFEISLMALDLDKYKNENIEKYIPLIKSTLTFYDEHYRYLAKRRGTKELDSNGKLVIYPGTSCETYKMAYNPTTTITALRTITQRLIEISDNFLTKEEDGYFRKFLERIPDYKYQEIDGKKTISPAWHWERINNTESPQLYPIFPWGVYGVTKPNLEIAQNTYLYDKDVLKFRGHESWKQDNIFSARIGLTDEASKYTVLKLKDSQFRFPAFWGPGFDWVPDHNWGGSGMIGLQEMLMQTDEEKIILFPAWPTDWDVDFKLHTPNNTTVECELKNGQITKLIVLPKARRADIEIFNKEIIKP